MPGMMFGHNLLKTAISGLMIASMMVVGLTLKSTSCYGNEIHEQFIRNEAIKITELIQTVVEHHRVYIQQSQGPWRQAVVGPHSAEDIVAQIRELKRHIATVKFSREQREALYVAFLQREMNQNAKALALVEANAAMKRIMLIIVSPVIYYLLNVPSGRGDQPIIPLFGQNHLLGLVIQAAITVALYFYFGPRRPHVDAKALQEKFDYEQGLQEEQVVTAELRSILISAGLEEGFVAWAVGSSNNNTKMQDCESSLDSVIRTYNDETDGIKLRIELDEINVDIEDSSLGEGSTFKNGQGR